MEENLEKCKEPCRLCDEASDKMYSIFGKTEEGHQILQLIKETLPIIIYRTDPLSKHICEKCFSNLYSLNKFKKLTNATQEKHKDKLRSADNGHNDNVQLYLGCERDMEEDENEELKDASTATDDLTILCSNCKQTILDASAVNGEIELCTDLHKAIAESLRKNRVATETDSEKVLRKRKIQPIYQELDDSLCSSLTEFTRNTEGDDDNSQFGFDSQSDSESESDEDFPRPSKRRKIENENDVEVPCDVVNDVDPLLIDKPVEVIEVNMEEIFRQEPEIVYEPLSLLQLALNAINKQNVPDYEPLEFITRSTHCECNHCGEQFQNLKLLALHETIHMDIELEEKIDNPMPWPEDKTDANVRNKWLTYFDENGYEEDDIVLGDVLEDTSLLIPVEDGKNRPQINKDGSNVDEIVLINMKPMVNGIYLGDYTKEERKSFYQSMRIGGLTKKFCLLCRYSFKDNWAIESHYFSLACHYTCRYCGMRFNKQRHRFDEHVQEHVVQNHEKSDKIFAASKINNIVPKIIHPDKVRKVVAAQEQQQQQLQQQMPLYSSPNPNQMQQFRVKNMMERRTLQPNLVLKEEPKEQKEIITSQSKTGNQAYFCRKCYKVFFKLDEFNIHSKNCDYNQFPSAFRQMQMAMSSPKPPPINHSKPSSNERTNGDISNAGRPVRNCVKEIGTYKDEVYIPKELLKETVNSPQQSFVCHICSTPFPTIYSRNSHMRIHKGEVMGSAQKPKPNPNYHFQQQMSHQQSPQQQQHPQPSFQYPKIAEVNIKQEPMDTSMEPMVEIHEGSQNYHTQPQPSSIGGGAVSITPISKNPNHKPTINPNVMRLVQNNPNITIKKSPEKFLPTPNNFPNMMPGSSQINNNPDADKSYKCSSCWEAFANKSHLYFHKKNQCEGSRFPCPFCKKRFGTEAAYSSHIFYSHPE